MEHFTTSKLSERAGWLAGWAGWAGWLAGWLARLSGCISIYTLRKMYQTEYENDQFIMGKELFGIHRI